ncbi:hypothetical protein GGTG_01241 [Gaeumannomyces tritici R3-111a-1]|uniref:Canalicular multispecific organic anion transporter 1 n=1 Tax=Gaeumannomyces tritici (strain R3-111a-1) TaxID=644352 RepID=J3NJ07_GAET3|nr:hypothetical protein GGTG_01241 [Gaeumannomyces tritici R3-111a-1]EJT81257.1 hypothetical protein GGTG_01241 [Gaeumannomyces tritici R3-111a-1]
MDSPGHFGPLIAAAGLGLVVGLSAPAIKHVANRRRQPSAPDSVDASSEAAPPVYLYEDRDGKATEQSMKDFSDAYPGVSAWASSAVGLGSAIAAAVLLAGRSGVPHSSFGMLALLADAISWTFLCVQCASLPLKHQYQTRYRLVLYSLGASAVLLASLLARFGAPVLHMAAQVRKSTPLGSVVLGVCWLVQIIAALGAVLSFASFRQRPDVYHEGHLVDQQHTASIIQRMSYSWNKTVFRVAKERQLEKADLPDLDHTRRSANLSSKFLARQLTGRLWRQLIVAHWQRLGQQWAISFVISSLALVPQYVLYNFLEILDKPSTITGGTDPILFAWVLCLCASLLLQVWVNSVMRWLTSSRLESPVLSLLQSMVFKKALRLKETASPPSKPSTDGTGNSDSKSSSVDTRTSIVNHMKLDSSRTVMAASWGYMFPVALFKLALSGTFLAQLVGFKSLAAGLLSSLLVLPISHLLSKRYAKIQFGLMKYRDGKAHLLTEALQGMRQIKFSALEQHWEDKILKSREEELAQFWIVNLWMSLTALVLNLGPLLLSSVTLAVYAFTTEGGIRASVIFASLGLFDQLDEAIQYLPLIQVYIMEAWTSCVRIEKFLGQPEKEPISTAHDHIAFESATFAWPKFEEVEGEGAEPLEARSVLRDVTLDFPSQGLSIITGNTGSGKSLLLAAILGEVTLISGKVRTPPAQQSIENLEHIADSDWIIPELTAFVPQTPWIETGTVRDNILFGLPLNATRYAKVLAACALEKDMALLVNGDGTEVGPKGVTLSGGQRWRVALARALYSRAGILVLDDVLSAVDAHVGKIIVDQALAGELANGRTRILATHHAELCLPIASYLVRLHEGRLESAETLAATPTKPTPVLKSDASSHVTGLSSSDGMTVSDHQSVSALTTPEDSDGEQQDKKSDKQKNKKKEDEEGREKGRVKWTVYKGYLSASNTVILWLGALLLIFSGRVILVGRTWSLKELSSSEPSASAASLGAGNVSGGGYAHGSGHGQVYVQNPIMYTPVFQQQQQQQAGGHRSVAFWIGAYIVLELAAVLCGIGRLLVFTAIGLRTARVLFRRMTHAILRAPLKWIDTVPSGRILNRFTSDIFTVDRRVAADLGSSLTSVLTVVTIIATSLSVSKYVNMFGLVLLALYARIAMEYISAAREVKRLNSVVWSPIYDQFSSVLTGLSTVRAFGRTDFYTNRMHNLIDTAAKTSWALSLSQRWMAFRMGVLGVFFVTTVAAAVALGHVDAALAGFSLTFALSYTSALTGLLQNMASIELGFNATERVLEYCDLKTEPQDGEDAPAAWPTEGRIEVENLTVAYKEELPPVLKDLTFTVESGERIGIVGRTGAGKSTLASVLFRLLEPRGGSVRIDNVDISKLKLSQLRSRLAIIPQDPFLFSGTLRSNLDMEGEMDDYQLQVVLQRVHLVKPESPDASRPSAYPLVPSPDGSAPAEATTGGDEGVGNAFKDLSMSISTGGANLSQGQRQLVCLARALLSRPKIVVLDEATSAVDRGTDAAIQESLREDFVAAGCTVFVIAHRLSTVADFDKILVLKDGRIAQMGTPAEILRAGMQAAEEESGQGSEPRPDDAGDGADDRAFWDLVRKSSEKEKLVEMILGEKA